jgi:hypothetical protein
MLMLEGISTLRCSTKEYVFIIIMSEEKINKQNSKFGAYSLFPSIIEKVSPWQYDKYPP